MKDHESVAVKEFREKLLEENRLLQDKLFARMPLKRKILIELSAIALTFLLVIQFSLTICAIKEQFSKSPISAHPSN